MPEIQITGVRFEVSDRIRSYVSEKLGGLRKFNATLTKVHVTIHPGEKSGYRVDVDMHLPHGKDVIAHDSEETVYAAIDVVADKCAAQLRKLHDKVAHHNMRHGERASA
jgi:putative sigma-54 modulation protein